MSGGLRDFHKSVLLTYGSEVPVAELQSTHEEADTRLMLHAIYAIQVEGVKRVVIYANDTDIVVLRLYYFMTKLQEMGLEELWMKTHHESYLPIHEISRKLDVSICHALPLIHSLSGRDISSYPFFCWKENMATKE